MVERKVTQGQYVNAGETMLTLADLSEIWIKADVYEDQLPQIRPGQDVDITAEALPNRTLHGHVQFIEPTTNPQTRTVPVHVHLANPGDAADAGHVCERDICEPRAGRSLGGAALGGARHRHAQDRLCRQSRWGI